MCRACTACWSRSALPCAPADICSIGSSVKPKAVKTIAAVMSLLVATLAEQYAERLWIVRTPSGGREIYHGWLSYTSLLVVFVGVALATYELGVRFLMRRTNPR